MWHFFNRLWPAALLMLTLATGPARAAEPWLLVETPVKEYSLPLDTPALDHRYLQIAVLRPVNLFGRGRWLRELPRGVHRLPVDSLRLLLGPAPHTLVLYSRQGLQGTRIELADRPRAAAALPVRQPRVFNNAFSDFFITATLLMLMVLVSLHFFFPDLAGQYLVPGRVLRLKVINELIYKVPFLAHPNIHFIGWQSLIFSFVFWNFTWFFPYRITWLPLVPQKASFPQLLAGWLLLALVISLFLVARYLLIRTLDSVFSLRIAPVHYASALRLQMLMALTLGLLLTIRFFFPLALSYDGFLIIFFALLGLTELLLFVKLTFAVSHTILYLIVYFCATELVPVVLFLQFITR